MYFIFFLLFLSYSYLYLYIFSYVSFFFIFFCTVHWADLSWPTFHYWLYPVWLCMWQIIKNPLKRRPFTSLCFVCFFKFLFSSCVLSLAASESAGREPSCPPIAGDHATGPPLTQCPPAHFWLNARRPASDSSPPDLRWLKPAGSPLTHACRPPLSLAPWIQSTRHGRESRVCVLSCPQEHFNEPCLVLSTETRLGQVAPLVLAAEAILAACPLVVEAVAEGPCEGPWCHVMPKGSLSFREQPRRASCSCGMSCPVCLALEGFLVLPCPVSVSSPGGLLIPPNFPMETFWGGRRDPAGVAWLRDEATAMKDHLPWPPELPAPPWPPELPAPPWSPELPAPPWSPDLPAQPWPPELPAPPWPPELPAPPWSPLSVPLWRSPSCGPVRVCPEGPPERPPTPPPWWNCYGVGHAFQEGGVMSGFCYVCVMCSRLLCPYLVCFLSSSDVIIS